MRPPFLRQTAILHGVIARQQLLHHRNIAPWGPLSLISLYI